MRKLWKLKKQKCWRPQYLQRERERRFDKCIFRVVDSVARFLYKIYNCVLDNLLQTQKACGWSVIDTGACRWAQPRGEHFKVSCEREAEP
jgi:hypothetical protein